MNNNNDSLKRGAVRQYLLDRGEVHAARYVAEMPVYTEPPLGKWTESYESECDNPFLRRRWTCSVCGQYNTYGTPPYCPYCGAKMGKEENE